MTTSTGTGGGSDTSGSSAGGSSTTGGCSNTGGGGAGGLEGDGGFDGDASGSIDAAKPGTGDATAPAGSTGIVLRYADLPPIGTGSTGTSGSVGSTSTGGPQIDPDTQYVFLGDAPVACRDPYASGACGHWRVTLGIPPALFKPGVLQLGCGDVLSSFSVTGPDRGGGDCYGGGGSFNQGTVEIVSITSQTVIVRLSGTMKFEVDPNGLYQAARCP
jgi:hypothetical protein